ncbi:integrase [Pseudomonas sp. F(2018)]|uniref:integrase n=1 Tax=Pseudomonas TaxID=286 RepID=UPI0010F72D58|nr:integrase [Pseudomonas sp. F(2018)]
MGESPRFSRREFLAAGNSCDGWKSIDIDLIPESIREEAENRIKAIQAYLNCRATLTEIEDVYGVPRSTLYRSINNCLAMDEEGVALGYKGAIPYRRNGDQKYKREKELRNSTDGGFQGDAGAFDKLLSEHPKIREWLEGVARSYKSRRQGGVSFDVLHNAFLEHCKSLSISNDQYPFSRKTLARSALREHIKAKHKEIKAHNEKERNDSDHNDNVPPTDVMQQVEADGHMLDFRLVIQELDGYGQPVRYEILRVWLILLIEAFSRCVLGYSIALGRTYDQVDLLKAIFNSLSPHQRLPQVNQSIRYSVSGGFPSEHGHAWETWSTLKLDNAWAHKATNVVRILHDRIGCVAEFGRPHTPNDRAIIERFFLFIVQHYSHRIVGTTGSDSRDKIIERLSPKSKNPLKMLLTLDELRSSIDTVISDYNGRPHSSLQSHSPLELFCMRRGQALLPPNELAETFRDSILFTMSRESVVVRTSSKYGGAYVNFAYLKYKNPNILRSDSAGRTMFIEYSREDVSFVRLLDEDGAFVGVLSPPHPWYLQPHSLKVRSELWRATKRGQFQFAREETPSEAFHRYKTAEGSISRSDATYLYRETGRIHSDDILSDNGVKSEDTDKSDVERVRLTKVFTL